MDKSVFKILMLLLALAFCASVPCARAATVNTFVLSDEGAGLITMLKNAGYANSYIYDALIAIVANSDPSISGIVTDAFINTLQSCPAGSAIFTTRLNSLAAGTSVAISDDCTVQTVWIHGESYFNKPGTTTLQTNFSGVGAELFTYSSNASTPLTSFLANGNTYNVFAIGWANIASQTFVLSNESPGNLITHLINAGYGDYNLYDALVQIQMQSDPSVAGILTDEFLSTLAWCPAGSAIFTTHVNDFNPAEGVSFAISTDGSVQPVNILAATYYNQPGTSTFQSNFDTVGHEYFVYPNDPDTSLTSWTKNIGGITRTYKVFAIVCSPGLSVINPPAGAAVQDDITLAAEASDNSANTRIRFYVYRAADAHGEPVGKEYYIGRFNPSTGHWESHFDTTGLKDGYYIVLARIVDKYGEGQHNAFALLDGQDNEKWSAPVNFSIRNCPCTALYPVTTGTYKAGQTIPVNFSLEVSSKIDPDMPFVCNQDLEIRIFKSSTPRFVLQTSHYGVGSTDYQIDSAAELYTTSFKTLVKPAQYVVQIWRPEKHIMIGSFTFNTTR